LGGARRATYEKRILPQHLIARKGANLGGEPTCRIKLAAYFLTKQCKKFLNKGRYNQNERKRPIRLPRWRGGEGRIQDCDFFSEFTSARSIFFRFWTNPPPKRTGLRRILFFLVFERALLCQPHMLIVLPCELFYQECITRKGGKIDSKLVKSETSGQFVISVDVLKTSLLAPTTFQLIRD